jgi:hypothetical protein
MTSQPQTPPNSHWTSEHINTLSDTHHIITLYDLYLHNHYSFIMMPYICITNTIYIPSIESIYGTI